MLKIIGSDSELHEIHISAQLTQPSIQYSHFGLKTARESHGALTVPYNIFYPISIPYIYMNG